VDLDFDADQDDLRDSIRGVLAKESPISLARHVAETGTPPTHLWQTMAELGWPALTIPEEHGGIGLGMVEAAILAEELGRVIAPGPLLSTVTQLVPVVRECGDDEQRARWLSAVAEGRVAGTLAIAEAGGSYEPDAAAAGASVAGDGFDLRGTKRYVVEAVAADELACTVRTDDGAVVVAMVPRDAVTIRPLRSFDPTRVVADVQLDGAHVERERVLTGDGVARALEEAAVAIALETVGVCQTIFDVALEHAKHREQFGVPIGSFQAIKHKFADLLIALERARSVGYFAALCIAEDDARRALAAAAAKAAAGDAQRLFGKEGIQILGGIGYTWEHDMQLLVKRAKANDVLFGGGGTARARLADLLGV
jgi:alkylation response protein AidB-like acyl-CoA dehydrogenase